MINLSLGAGEVLGILVAITTLAWTLLQMVFKQYDEKQDARHKEVSTQYVSLEKKVSAIDALVLEVKKLEIEQLRRDAQYSEKFVTKAEMDNCQIKHDKIVERIFKLLETMNDKLDSKVNKQDCDNRWTSQTRSKERVEQ
jgi:hypothetical protein